MSNYYPKRIGISDVEYEGVYEFYKRLERRHSADALWKFFMALSVPIVFLVFSYISAHYVNWKPVTASLQQVL